MNHDILDNRIVVVPVEGSADGLRERFGGIKAPSTSQRGPVKRESELPPAIPYDDGHSQYAGWQQHG